MARTPSLVRNALTLVGLGPLPEVTPADGAAPEEVGAPPTPGVYSRSPELAVSGPYLKQIQANDDEILLGDGAGLALFDRLLDDDVAMSSLQQRRLAITSRDWEVTPGDDKDPRSVQAAEDWRQMLAEVGFDRVTGLLHYGVWYGYAVGEAVWTTKARPNGRKVWLKDIVVPNRRWFGFTGEGELRFASLFGSLGGEQLPPNKFFSIRTGGTHDFAFYGLGLAHWAYWPVWFKRAATRFWALYLEKLSKPTAVGEFKESDTEEDKNELMTALMAMGHESAVAVPQGSLANIKFMEAMRSASGTSTYRDFVTENNDALMRIILGQPGTSKATPGGIGSTQADVHADVKHEIIKADADLICEAINTSVAKWITAWNYGEEVAAPKVYRVLDDEEDLNTTAERDERLDRLGWRRSEASFEQTFGEGYERKPEPKPIAPGSPGQLPAGRQPADVANDDDPEDTRAEMARRRAEFDATDPRPLYVSRRLQNVAEFTKWAKSQGFDTVDDGLHVTVLYSRKPVNWFGMGEAWGSDENGGLTIRPGGPRRVEKLGDKAALVFESSDIRWRHDAMIERGATHDFDEFVVHVSIADAGDRDLEAVEAYQGELVFGPELFEALDADPLQEMTMFSAAEEAAIDTLTAALVDEANPAIREFAASIRDTLAEAKETAGGELSLEGARVALLQAFERFDPKKLAGLTGLSFVAQRAAAEVGADEDLTA